MGSCPGNVFSFVAKGLGDPGTVPLMELRNAPAEYFVSPARGLVMSSHANAHAIPDADILAPKLREVIKKHYSDLGYKFLSRAISGFNLDRFRIGEPERFIVRKHFTLTMADQRLPVYPVVAQFTVFDRFGQDGHKEADYYCFVTIKREWDCVRWSLEARDIP
jgi:hypothetical protein